MKLFINNLAHSMPNFSSDNFNIAFIDLRTNKKIAEELETIYIQKMLIYGFSLFNT